MPPQLLASAAALSDTDLARHLSLLAERERGASVELVAHLAVFDARKLHLGQGYGSLFGYCTEELRLAEHAAYNRIEAARVARRCPVILHRLADGSLNLSTLRLVAPHLTPDNHERLLAEAACRRQREVEVLVSGLSPLPDVPDSIRKLPPPRLAPHLSVGPALPASSPPQPPASPERTPAAPAATAAMPAPRPVVAPLAPDRYRVQFTVGKETHEKLQRARDLLRREIPSGDPGAIFDRGLTLLLQDVARRRWAQTSSPRPGHASSGRSRYVPSDVRRTVWLRDGGRCAYVAQNGHRCREQAFLEFHHLDPYALGGETTAANVSLRCRAHNAYEAELLFGPRAPALREELAGGASRGASGMRTQAAGDETQATREQGQHHEGVEQAGGLEVDAEVHQDARQDDHRSRQGQDPAQPALAIEEQQADAEQQRNQGQAEAVVAEEAPEA